MAIVGSVLIREMAIVGSVLIREMAIVGNVLKNKKIWKPKACTEFFCS
jgi:hypothetical protein